MDIFIERIIKFVIFCCKRYCFYNWLQVFIAMCVSINMGTKWWLLYRLCFKLEYFVNIITVKIFNTKNYWSRGFQNVVYNFFSSKWDLPLFQDWRRCYEICPDSSFLKINKTIQMYKISATFKATLYVIYQVSLIKDDITTKSSLIKGDIPTESSFNYHVHWGQTLNSNLRVCAVRNTSLQILLLYMTTFSTIFNKISIYLGIG